jgi:anaerobic glycerol-3-phosphate dehydrogenase
MADSNTKLFHAFVDAVDEAVKEVLPNSLTGIVLLKTITGKFNKKANELINEMKLENADLRKKIEEMNGKNSVKN